MVAISGYRAETGRALHVDLEWSPDELRAKSDAAAGPSLDEALLATMGLRLEARKVPTQIIVIDSAVPASTN